MLICGERVIHTFNPLVEIVTAISHERRKTESVTDFISVDWIEFDRASHENCKTTIHFTNLNLS